MTDEETPKTLYCHKNVSMYCRKEECPMWFIPPNPEAEGDCAEALNEKQAFWEVIKRISDDMAARKTESSAEDSA